MIREMTITISVSGETEGDCEYALLTGIDMVRTGFTKGDGEDIQEGHHGNLDEGEEEVHWKYQITTKQW